MTALASLRTLKEAAIMAQDFERAAALRDVERKLVLEQRQAREDADDLARNAVAILHLYYEDQVADPMLLLSRMGQVSEVIARGEFETLPMIQPCRKCGRELGSRLSGPQDHDTCPPGRCQARRSLPQGVVDRLHQEEFERVCRASVALDLGPDAPRSVENPPPSVEG